MSKQRSVQESINVRFKSLLNRDKAAFLFIFFGNQDT